MEVKLTLSKINTFDAAKDLTVYYDFSGGTVRGSRIVIYSINNGEKSLVDSHEYRSLKTEHIINAGIFENNNQYQIELSVIYTDENNIQYESDCAVSNTFYCYKEPTLTIDGFEENKAAFLTPKINTLTICANDSAENNYITNFKVCVYTDKKCTHLYTETDFFDTPVLIGETENITINKLGFSKFNHKIEQYYFVVKGITVFGQKTESPAYPVVIDYTKHIAPFQAEQDDGHINLSFKLYDNVGYFENGKLSYLFDLPTSLYGKYPIINYGDSLIYDINLNKDFTIFFKLSACRIDDKTPLLILKGKNPLYLIPELSDKNVSDLPIDNSLINENIRMVLIGNKTILNYSNTVTKNIAKSNEDYCSLSTDTTVCIRRKDGYYDVMLI